MISFSPSIKLFTDYIHDTLRELVSLKSSPTYYKTRQLWSILTYVRRDAASTTLCGSVVKVDGLKRIIFKSDFCGIQPTLAEPLQVH